MPSSTGMTTAQFVTYIIFSIISLPVMWIRPHKLQKFFYFASTVTIVFFIAFLIWALATMGPAGFGDTITGVSDLSATGVPDSLGWLMIYGIMSTIGSIAAGILNQNDYARFAIHPNHAIFGQAVAFPLYGILCSVIGILVTAATQNRFGEAIWNPPTVFSQLIAQDPSRGTRAAAFFGGLALVISQIGVNVPGNALSGGFDLAATFPRYINIRRGAYITAIFSVVVNPWKLVNTATTFLTVLSSYSVFLGSMTGLMVAGYLMVCRSKINVDHLYRGNSSSIYWYTYGINWRAPVAVRILNPLVTLMCLLTGVFLPMQWTVGFAPLMPGFIAAVNTSVSVSDGAIEIYYMNYLYGFFASAAVFVLLHKIFPSPDLDGYVQNSTTSKEAMYASRDKWDNTQHESGAIFETGDKSNNLCVNVEAEDVDR